VTLQTIGSDEARCVRCGALAVGPCARCHNPVCGDCCVLTEGGVRTWAVCLGCAERAGTGLTRAWLRLIAWILAPIALLAALVVGLYWLAH
jgi:hypothetical protein